MEIVVHTLGGRRPPAITPSKYLRICECLALGAYPRTASAAAGISHATLNGWRRRGRKYAATLHSAGAEVPDPIPLADVKALADGADEWPLPLLNEGDLLPWYLECHCEQSLAVAQTAALNTIHAAASRGDWRAAGWMLEHRWPELYAVTRERVQVDAETRDTLQRVSDEELASQIDELQSRLAAGTEPVTGTADGG